LPERGRGAARDTIWRGLVIGRHLHNVKQPVAVKGFLFGVLNVHRPDVGRIFSVNLGVQLKGGLPVVSSVELGHEVIVEEVDVRYSKQFGHNGLLLEKVLIGAGAFGLRASADRTATLVVNEYNQNPDDYEANKGVISGSHRVVPIVSSN